MRLPQLPRQLVQQYLLLHMHTLPPLTRANMVDKCHHIHFPPMPLTLTMEITGPGILGQIQIRAALGR